MLGGRVVAIGGVDGIGLLLGLAVLLWIPAHNLTYNMLRMDDYRQAGIPTFPSIYGFGITRRIIAFSSLLVTLAMLMSCIWIGLPPLILYLLAGFQAGLVGLALLTWLCPSIRMSTGLFRYASFYMLGCMILLAANAL